MTESLWWLAGFFVVGTALWFATLWVRTRYGRKRRRRMLDLFDFWE
ncbi:MAG: hypothetical protein WC054_00710 [Candidatus Nanopelagicales bacterium]